MAALLAGRANCIRLQARQQASQQQLRCTGRVSAAQLPCRPAHAGAQPRRAAAFEARAAAADVAEAPAAPAQQFPSPVAGLSDEQRAELAQELGYRQIGKDLPSDVTLQRVISTLPKDVYEIKPLRAWGAVATTLASMAGCLWLIAQAPWYMLPFAWALAGTAFTGFFVVGHDCGHRSFSKNKLLEDIVGTLMFAPLIYPFEPWRIKHNHHHAHTNKLVEDTAWHPVMKEEVEEWGNGARGSIFKFFLGTPLKLWASVGHWALWHFDVNKFTDRQKPRVYVSWAAVAAFALIGLPALTLATGFTGLVKFWLMPWLGYHFWMSTFTVVHHTAPHIPFKPAESWNAAQAQLAGTVHCDFPAWVEFLTHDISVHVPHHVNSKIPWYNLRKANDSLKANWGQYMTEATFNWRMMKTICTELHIYDEEANYKPFDSIQGHEHPLFELQRKYMPSTYTASS